MASLQIPDHPASEMIIDHDRGLRILIVRAIDAHRDLMTAAGRNLVIIPAHTGLRVLGEHGKAHGRGRARLLRAERGHGRLLGGAMRKKLELRVEHPAIDLDRLTPGQLDEQIARQF